MDKKYRAARSSMMRRDMATSLHRRHMPDGAEYSSLKLSGTVSIQDFTFWGQYRTKPLLFAQYNG